MLKKQFIAKAEIDEGEHAIVAIINTDTVDRDGEVLLPKGANWENYEKNPVVLWAHDYSGTPIGRTLWLKKTRTGIKVKALFAETEKAEEIYQLYKDGFLSAFSVGFMPAEGGSHTPTPEEIKKKPEWAEARRIYDDWELLEFSAVPVPANPDALLVAVKSNKVAVSNELQDELGIEKTEDSTGSIDLTGSDDFVEEPLEASPIVIVKTNLLRPTTRYILTDKIRKPASVLNPQFEAAEIINRIKGKMF